MMTPTWILNFSKDEPLGSFFEKHWQASCQNDNRQSNTKRWFYCTDCTGLSFDELIQTAKQLTADLSDSRPKLIPYVDNNTQELRVICMGDITDGLTISSMHIWAAQLRLLLLTTPWTHIPTIRFYAVLWRPYTAAIEPGISNESKSFLNGLASLETLDINHRPFHKVLFIESSVKREEKSTAFRMMEQVALHIALSGTRALGDLNDDATTFLSAGNAAVFFEAKVQREQEAHLLGNLLLDKFCNSTDSVFYDVAEVENYIDKKQSDYLNTFSPDNIANVMIEDHPQIPSEVYSTEDFSTKSSWGFAYGKIWSEFFLREIGGFKVRLINHLGWYLDMFQNDFLERINANQVDYINNEKKRLENVIFSIYAKDTQFKHIGIQQGLKVLERLRSRISMLAKNVEDADIHTFILPKKLDDALQQAKSDHPEQTTKNVLAVLESKLRTLPAFNMALTARALILGLIFGFIGNIVSKDDGVMKISITALCAIIPFICSLVSFVLHARRINRLKDQYIACRLSDMKLRLQDFVLQKMKDTYSEIDIFLEWVKTNKLDFLRKNLSVVAPSSFTFEPNSHFQPLLNYNLSQSSEVEPLPLPYIPYKPINVPTDESLAVQISGTFGDQALLCSTPINQVDVNGNNRTLFQLMSEEGKEDCQTLCKSLMSQKATIASGLEKTISFGSSVIASTKLLLLDVSGSMSSQPLEDLKSAVYALQTMAEIQWIAFDDKVVATSFDGTDIASLSAGGGTCYIPAIQEAVKYLSTNYVDQIILVSDGCPFESLESILKEAAALNKPLNTITIGHSAQEIMKQIAEQTGGEQVVVESASEIKRDAKEIFEQLQAAEGGTFVYSELMQKCRLDGLAQALYDFTNQHVDGIHDKIAELIIVHGNKDGICEWFKFAQPTCTLAQAARVKTTSTHLMIVGGNQNERLEEYLEKGQIDIKEIGQPAYDLDMIASVLSYQSVDLQHFLWACYSDNDNSLDKESIVPVMQQGYPFINIFGKEINKP